MLNIKLLIKIIKIEWIVKPKKLHERQSSYNKNIESILITKIKYLNKSLNKK